MKPKFFELPAAIRNDLLWDMNLDYDSYESSMSDCIYNIQCGNASIRNKEIIDHYYDSLTADSIVCRLKSHIDSLKQSIDDCEELIAKMINT